MVDANLAYRSTAVDVGPQGVGEVNAAGDTIPAPGPREPPQATPDQPKVVLFTYLSAQSTPQPNFVYAPWAKSDSTREGTSGGGEVP